MSARIADSCANVPSWRSLIHEDKQLFCVGNVDFCSLLLLYELSRFLYINIKISSDLSSCSDNWTRRKRDPSISRKFSETYNVMGAKYKSTVNSEWEGGWVVSLKCAAKTPETYDDDNYRRKMKIIINYLWPCFYILKIQLFFSLLRLESKY